MRIFVFTKKNFFKKKYKRYSRDVVDDTDDGSCNVEHEEPGHGAKHCANVLVLCNTNRCNILTCTIFHYPAHTNVNTYPIPVQPLVCAVHVLLIHRDMHK